MQNYCFFCTCASLFVFSAIIGRRFLCKIGFGMGFVWIMVTTLKFLTTLKDMND